MTVANRAASGSVSRSRRRCSRCVVWSVGTGEIAIPPGEVVATLLGGGDRADRAS